jgi:hypothetical protein
MPGCIALKSVEVSKSAEEVNTSTDALVRHGKDKNAGGRRNLDTFEQAQP